jgi:hypothetical protein
MNRKEWREKLKKARTQAEFSELLDQIPEATEAEVRTEAREFFIMEQKMIYPHLTSTPKTGKT